MSFEPRLELLSADGWRRCSGKEFHVLGAATRKLRLPNSVLEDGTHRSPRCAERSLTLPPISVSRVQMPQKYEGQVPRTQSKASSLVTSWRLNFRSQNGLRVKSPVSWASFLPIFSLLHPSILDLGSGMG